MSVATPIILRLFCNGDHDVMEYLGQTIGVLWVPVVLHHCPGNHGKGVSQLDVE